MGHIGNTVQTAFTSFDKQTITGTGTSVYTLSHNVANEQEIEVFVNNVRQEGGSGKAYTVSGNQITFSENIASTDTVYVNFQGKAVQTVSHPSDQPMQATTGTFSSNVDVGGSLLVNTIKDGAGTNTAMTIDSSGRVTTPARPAFWAYKADNTGIVSTGTYVFNVAPVNVGNCYNTTNGVFTAPVTGLYHFSVSLQMFGANSARSVHYFVNGSQVPSGADAGSVGELDQSNRHQTVSLTRVLSLNANDEVTIYQNGFRGMQSNFCGFLLG